MKSPEEIIAEAMAFNPVAIRVGYSGGDDSIVAAHWMMNNVPGCEVFHCNTGIGIERTRRHVRDTCKQFGWRLHEIRAKEDCGMDYDAIVLKHGFPGGAQHSAMYSQLKERPIRLMVRRLKQKRNDKVLIASGVRHDESARRMIYAGEEVTPRGAQLWCNPIYWWSASQRDAYIKEHNLPRNPVSVILGMSGECLCGAFAHEGEKSLIRTVCPGTADRIDALEKKTLAAGFTWGWEGSPPAGWNPGQTDMFMPMCVGCEKVHNEVEP